MADRNIQAEIDKLLYTLKPSQQATNPQLQALYQERANKIYSDPALTAKYASTLPTQYQKNVAAPPPAPATPATATSLMGLAGQTIKSNAAAANMPPPTAATGAANVIKSGGNIVPMTTATAQFITSKPPASQSPVTAQQKSETEALAKGNANTKFDITKDPAYIEMLNNLNNQLAKNSELEGKFNDITAQLKALQTPVQTDANAYNSKYDQGLMDTLALLSNRINNPAQYDYTTDVGLQQAQKSAIDAVSRAAARKNMLYSDSNKYSMGQAAMELIPQFQDRFENRQQQQLSNQFAMLNALQGMEGIDYNRFRDMISDQRYANELGYDRGRDAIADARYDDNLAYSRGRDTIADQRYTDELGYSRGRDTIGDQRYADNLAYSRGRDVISDQRYADETAYNRGIDLAQITGYYQTPEIKAAINAEIPKDVREKINKYSSMAGGIQGYINTLNPQSAEYVYANRMRNEKILGNEELYKKYGDTVVKEFGLPTLAKKSFDSQEAQRLWENNFKTEAFNWEKSVTQWEQKFKTEQFNWQKAQAEIENNFKQRQADIENSYKNRQITLQEKQAAFEQSMAIKNFQLSAARAARASSGGSRSSGGSSGSGSSSSSSGGLDQSQYNKYFDYYSKMLEGKWVEAKDNKPGHWEYENDKGWVANQIANSSMPADAAAGLLSDLGLDSYVNYSNQGWKKLVDAGVIK